MATFWNPTGSGASENARSALGGRLLARATLRLGLDLGLGLSSQLSDGSRGDGSGGDGRLPAVLVGFQDRGRDTAAGRYLETVGGGPFPDRRGLLAGSARPRRHLLPPYRHRATRTAGAGNERSEGV